MPYQFLLTVAASTLFSKYLLDVFFKTPSPAQWVNMLLLRKPGDSEFLYTREDFDNFIFAKAPYWVQSLLGCRWCMSLYVTLFVSLFFCLTYAPWYSFSLLWLLSLGINSFFNDGGTITYTSAEKDVKNTRDYNTVDERKGHEPVEAIREKPSSDNTIRRNGVTMVRDRDKNRYVVTSIDPEREAIMEILESEKDHQNASIAELQKGYRAELGALKKEKPDCPKCMQNGIMHKYYESIRKIYNANPRYIEEVRGSRESDE